MFAIRLQSSSTSVQDATTSSGDHSARTSRTVDGSALHARHRPTCRFRPASGVPGRWRGFSTAVYTTAVAFQGVLALNLQRAWPCAGVVAATWHPDCPNHDLHGCKRPRWLQGPREKRPDHDHYGREQPQWLKTTRGQRPDHADHGTPWRQPLSVEYSSRMHRGCRSAAAPATSGPARSIARALGAPGLDRRHAADLDTPGPDP